MAPLPLAARPRDWFFVLVFAAFAFTSFLVDTLPALGWSTFMHDALVASYADCDPMFMRPPPFLLVAATVSGFVWGPLYCWFVWGFVRGRAVIRVPALLYAGAHARHADDLRRGARESRPRLGIAAAVEARGVQPAVPHRADVDRSAHGATVSVRRLLTRLIRDDLSGGAI